MAEATLTLKHVPVQAFLRILILFSILQVRRAGSYLWKLDYKTEKQNAVISWLNSWLIEDNNSLYSVIMYNISYFLDTAPADFVNYTLTEKWKYFKVSSLYNF